MAESEPVTLDTIHRLLLKIEKDVRNTKSNVERHDNRFNSIDSRLTVLDDNDKAINERISALEDTLDIEAKERSGTIGERLDRLERQVANINDKLKAG